MNENKKLRKPEPDIEGAIARNAQRIYILSGILLLVVSTTGISQGVYLASAPHALLGGWLLGGWPAIRRLARNPRMQLRHWWHILRNTRKIHITEWPDGSTDVSLMKPVRTNGWGWVEVRDNNR
jgi:hypothetical protein